MREATMHSLMLVTISMPAGATSEEIRQKVEGELLADDSFCGDGGRFGAPLCDWFVIGGRWSGLLAETMIGDAYRAAVITRFPALKSVKSEWWPESLAANHSEELDALWQQQGGTGPSPWRRDGYESFADDAMVITQKLYDALLAEYAGEVNCDGEFVDLDNEPLGVCPRIASFPLFDPRRGV
jgi:hypothetical protein